LKLIPDIYLSMSKNIIIIFLLIGILTVLCVIPANAKTDEEIYQEKSAVLKDDDIKGHYDLGEWCLKNKLLEQAKTQFNKVIELNPKYKTAKQNIEKIIQLEKDAKIAEIIKKYGPYKDVLDKPGADTEKLPWENAREKETENFIVKTNLSMDALNDICCLLECARFIYQDFFGTDFERFKRNKLNVFVMKNRDDYEKVFHDVRGDNPSKGHVGIYVPGSYPGNKSRQAHILSYYDPLGQEPLISTLFHEGTHHVIELIEFERNCPRSPIWLNEGLAIYLGSSKLENGKIVPNISQVRLHQIKKVITKQSYIKLEEFINRASAKYDSNICYPEGWSLVYFLLNSKYKDVFKAYMESWGKSKIPMDKRPGNYYPKDKIAHLKLFEECIGVPIDQLEKEWKEYILGLK